MKSSLKLAALSAAMMALPVTSLALTDTAAFDVNLTLLASCSVSTADDMNFGTHSESDLATTPAIANTNIGITCSLGTPFDVGLSDTNATRAMHSVLPLGAGLGSEQAYGLFQDAAFIQPWDEMNTVSGVGTGAVEVPLVVHGQTSGAPTINGLDSITGAGIDLQDTITVTVTY